MSIRATIKRKGRPATGKGTPISVRLQPDQLAALDAWIEAQGGGISRPKAIRLLFQKGIVA
ncbi:MAG: hypothetical protein ACT6Q7_14075 [Blastomonas fulva]|uniref:hypothetical protein n=1 Tax=Blastomonas fulva TaxID=1550728 RepID=UPI004033C214